MVTFFFGKLEERDADFVRVANTVRRDPEASFEVIHLYDGTQLLSLLRSHNLTIDAESPSGKIITNISHTVKLPSLYTVNTIFNFKIDY